MIREAASEGPIVLHIRFYSLFNNSKKQLGAPAQAWQQYSMHDRMLDLEIQINLRRRNFIERIKAPIFLEAVLGIEIK